MFNLLISHKISFLLTSLLILFLIIVSIGYKNHIYTFQFVDEDDNFTVAKYLNQGERIYSDIFSHHQPVTYILSSVIQKTKYTNNINQLIKYHRYFIIVYGVIWCLFLFYKFRIYVLPFIVLYELTKIHLSGHTFLAEAIIVYPLVYLFLSVLLNKPKKSNLEYLFIGINITVIMFTLAPLWPILLFLICILLFKNKTKIFINAGFILLGFLFTTIIIFNFLSFKDYFYNTIYLNIYYYITPDEKTYLFRSFFSFIYYILIKDVAIFIRISSLFYLVLSTYFASKIDKYIPLITFTALGLANIRFASSGFHLLPWYGLLICSISFMTIRIIENNKIKFNQKSLITLLVFMLCIFILYIAKGSLFKNIDSEKEMYISYSQQYDYGKVVNVLKREDDSLMVIPIEPLILWQADINHSTKYPFYYSWMDKVLFIKNEIIHTFDNNPPTFLYYNSDYATYETINKYLHMYKRINKHNKNSYLYILKNKYKTLNKDELNNLNFYNFTIQ